MNEIFLTIIFFAPGLAMKTAYKFFNRKKEDEESKVYEYLFEIIVHGCIVFFALLVVISLAANWIPCIETLKMGSFTEMAKNMDCLSFATIYFIGTSILTFIWYKIFYKWIYPLFEKKKSKYTKEKYGVETESNKTVYEKVFRDPENKDRLVPVELIKDGKRISCGILNYRNAPNYSKMEFTLDYTEEIEEILNDDKYREEKIIEGIRFEYYVPEYDLLVRFFSRTKLERYWAEKYKSED